jgi:hypothetical protein
MPPFPETRSYVKRVGKELNETKAKQQRKTETPAKPAGDFNPIRAFIDVMGRTYYKTP